MIQLTLNKMDEKINKSAMEYSHNYSPLITNPLKAPHNSFKDKLFPKLYCMYLSHKPGQPGH